MNKNKKPDLIPIEFELGNSMNEEISDTSDYLVKFKTKWYGGRFEKFVFGWVFKGIYAHGCRLGMDDGWEKIYRIDDSK